MKATVINLVVLFFFINNMISAQEKLYPNEFPLGDIILLDSPFKHARDLNIQTLLKYDTDRLLAPYRKVAGLSAKVSNYPNWESDGLDGHIAGHYLSAMAMNFAATGNKECEKRMNAMIAELKICQDSNTLKYPDWGVGYAGGMPYSNILWPEIKKGNVSFIWKYWVPWYNVHKMYAGLRDAWIYAGNDQAKSIFLKFCDWAINITSNLSEDQMQSMLDQEQGGMNEIFADAFQLTGDPKYLTAAKRFSHHMLLDAMSADKDNLDNRHANTQVPKAIGFARIGELSHDKTYQEAGSFFWENVTGNRSLAFGGNSRREFFPAINACYDFINDVEGPESCNTYNMLKLTEDLFRMNPQVRYIDYYERAVYNHILSTQHPEHGGYVYFTPVRPRHYRVYSAPEKGMWCCVGSGMENHGKYNQLIYTHTNDSLYLNLFIASELNWKDKGVKIRQENKFPFEEQTKLSILEGSSKFTLLIRYPSWVKDGALRIIINDKEFQVKSYPSSYVAINRTWKAGDKVQILLPMHNSIEHLPNMPDYIAFMHGPVVLGARTGTEDLTGLIADESRWGHIPGGERLPIDKAPIITEDNIENIGNNLVPVNDKPLHFTLSDCKMINPIPIEFEPFYQIHDSRYMIYWLALTNSQYKTYLDSIANLEKEKLELQKRTVDFVAPGEQQPEADHAMQSENSKTGNYYNSFWRDASNGGYFSYSLSTRSESDLILIVRYWGAEWGKRKLDIYVDNEKLISEDNTGRWNQSKFQDIEYPIPNDMLKGKDHIRLKFQSLPDNTAGAVYYIRLVSKK